jgi:hypothetical protein
MGGAAFDNLSEDQQTAVTEARQLRDAGDKEGAKTLLEEVGVPLKSKMRKARNHNEDVKAAIEEDNYEAFLTATANAPFGDQVDEAFFGKIVEMHSLKESGDIESAEAIREELGLPERAENKREGQREMRSELTDEEKVQFDTARESGDRDAAREIMKTIRANHSEN